MSGLGFYYRFAAVWIVLAVVCSILLVFIPAPYGKFTRKGFGPLVDRRAGWIAMETPAVWAMAFFFAFGRSTANPVAIVFLVMWEIHYLYRTYVFPFRMRGEKRQMTLLAVLFGVVFNTGNAYLNGHYIFTMSEPYPGQWFFDARFFLGAGLFAVGLGINIHSDAILRSLRKPGEAGYKIQPNYFGEIVEWAGWALATWSLGGLVFFMWTASNLVPRALSHHKWYLSNFPSYPRRRKALIPFVF
jgi:hypothetical protein